MTATVIILPAFRCEDAQRTCHRCGGTRRVTFDQMSEAQQRWAPFGAVFPCPDCGPPEPPAPGAGVANGADRSAEIIPFEECQRRVGAIMAEG